MKERISESKFYTWGEHEGFIRQYGAKGFSLIRGFLIKVIPKYGSQQDADNQNQYFGNLIKQKSFLDTFFSVFINPDKGLHCGLELRLISNPVEKRINCYVLLKLLQVADAENEETVHIRFDQLTSEFTRIFPKDYLIEEIDEATLNSILSFDLKVITEVVKATKMLAVGNITDLDHVEIATLNTFDHHNTDIRYNIPCCSYLQPKLYNFYSFYQLLLEVDFEAHVRIAVGASEIFEVEKSTATLYHSMIHRLYGHSNNPEIANYLKSFSKYLSANHLYGMKIQVMADTEGQSLEIANSLCSQLSFSEINTVSHLKCVSLSDQERNLLENDWARCNTFYFSLLDDTQDSYDRNTLAFIKRQMYLYDEAEVMAIFRLPISDEKGLPGFDSRLSRPFHQPFFIQKKGNEQKISLGKIERSAGDSKPIDYSIPISDLTKHGLIVGSTGSGKTNTTLHFVRELKEHGIPFLLIEPVKSEYYDELSPYFDSGKLNRFNFKNPFLKDGTCNPEYLRFNPFFPVPGVSLIQHISYMKGCFNAAFPMSGIMPLIFEECLRQVYLKVAKYDNRNIFEADQAPRYPYDTKRELLDDKDLERGDALTPLVLKDVADKYLSNKELFSASERKDFGNYLRRRIEKLTTGVLGHAFCPELWLEPNEDPACIPNNIMKMLTEPTVVELEDLADNDEKALIMAFILSYMFEFRQTMPSVKSIQHRDKGRFNISDHIHITVIEEAHRLLSSSHLSPTVGGEDGVFTQDSKSKSISLFIDMLAEIRAKGEGIFIVEQIPTKLVSDVIKNTNLKIMHRITSKDDRHYLGEAMNMNEQQKNYINNLQTGEAVIFDEQLDYPVFVKINEFKHGEEDRR